MRRILPILFLTGLPLLVLPLLLLSGRPIAASPLRQISEPRGSFLVITKTAPAMVDAGEPITYTLTVHNRGIAPVTSVVITDLVPANAYVVTTTTGTLEDGIVSWSVPALEEDAMVDVRFVVTATETITNVSYRARAFGNIATGSVPPVVTVVSPPPLVLSKRGPASVLPGGRITYQLTLTNTTTSALSNVVITDRVPAGASYVAGSGGTLSSGVVRWTLPTLPAGQSRTFIFAVTASQTVVNNDYAVRADGVETIAGGPAVTTAQLVLRTYLPIVVNVFRVEEPNNGCNSPYHLWPDVDYRFSPDDRDDWFVIDLTTLDGTTDVEFALRNFEPVNGQIVVYRGATCSALTTVGNNGDAARTKIVSVPDAPADRYFIWVINDGALLPDRPYALRVTLR